MAAMSRGPPRPTDRRDRARAMSGDHSDDDVAIVGLSDSEVDRDDALDGDDADDAGINEDQVDEERPHTHDDDDLHVPYANRQTHQTASSLSSSLHTPSPIPHKHWTNYLQGKLFCFPYTELDMEGSLKSLPGIQTHI